MADRWSGTSWRITAVGDHTISGEATITFDDEGRVAGRSVVNRFFGTYTVEGDTIRFGPLGSTMMASSPEAMAEEQLVLRALDGSLSVIDDRDDTHDADEADGHVVLRGSTTDVRLAPATPVTEV